MQIYRAHREGLANGKKGVGSQSFVEKRSNRTHYNSRLRAHYARCSSLLQLGKRGLRQSRLSMIVIGHLPYPSFNMIADTRINLVYEVVFIL